MVLTFKTYNLIDFDLQSYKEKSILHEKLGTLTFIIIDGKNYQIFQKKGTKDFCLINFNYKYFGECEVTKSNFFTAYELYELV